MIVKQIFVFLKSAARLFQDNMIKVAIKIDDNTLPISYYESFISD
jgi:hypothetical protein